jgi:hypothetical protein
VDNAAALQAGAAFEAMLLVPMLRPMLPAGEAIGEYGLDLLARELATRDGRGFAGIIAAQLEKRP